ncbi:hypothetical protein HAX54_039817 [Datura stramonium]|uniref:Uncharacterized protein n=1 Tax=Datura stramonium TaxID=4076 RepID=A0ABS8VNL4_DATST|nr:hypothetical protein [Datura stramonium]
MRTAERPVRTYSDTRTIISVLEAPRVGLEDYEPYLPTEECGLDAFHCKNGYSIASSSVSKERTAFHQTWIADARHIKERMFSPASSHTGPVCGLCIAKCGGKSTADVVTVKIL